MERTEAELASVGNVLSEICDRLDAGICRLGILHDRMGYALPLTEAWLDLAKVYEGLDEEIAELDMLHDLVVNALARLQWRMEERK